MQLFHGLGSHFFHELSKRDECRHPFWNFQKNQQHANGRYNRSRAKDRLDALQLLLRCDLSTPQMLW